MKYFVVVVRDRAADAFMQPWFASSQGGAVRAFKDEINRKGENNHLARHPEDYDLFHLGMFDDRTGLFETGTPSQIAVGKDQVTRVE